MFLLSSNHEVILDEVLLLPTLKEWTRYCWKLRGNFRLSLMGDSLILFEVEVAGK